MNGSVMRHTLRAACYVIAEPLEATTMYRYAVLISWLLAIGFSVVPVQATPPYTCVTYGAELGAKWLYPTGLNNQGQVVGSYGTVPGQIYTGVRSFLREATGAMETIAY